MKAKATPEGYHTLNPILTVPDVTAALDFYTEAFGATEDFRREIDDRLLVVVVILGDCRMMIRDVSAGGDTGSGGGISLKIYVDEVDAVFRRAVAAGGIRKEAPADQYFGERVGRIVDPFGITWLLSEFQEDVPHAEIERLMQESAEA